MSCRSILSSDHTGRLDSWGWEGGHGGCKQGWTSRCWREDPGVLKAFFHLCVCVCGAQKGGTPECKYLRKRALDLLELSSRQL